MNKEQVNQDRANQEIDKLLNRGDDYTEHTTAQYLANLTQDTNISSPLAYDICAAIESTLSEDDIDGFVESKKKRKAKISDEDMEEDKESKSTYKIGAKSKDRTPVNKKDWEALNRYFKNTAAATNDIEEPLEVKNLIKIAEFLGLNDAEKDILKLLYSIENNYQFTILMQYMVSDTDQQKQIGPIAARMIGKPENHKLYSKALSHDGRLAQYGVIDAPKGGGMIFPFIDAMIVEHLGNPELSEEKIVKHLLGTPTQTELDIDDFNYLGKDLDLTLNIIKGAIEKGEKGINILLHGPAGAGKTELSKAIAQKLGLKLYATGEEEGAEGENYEFSTDAEGNSTERSISTTQSSSKTRLAQYKRAQALLKDNKEAFILFDEIEDLMIKGADPSKGENTESKIELNRLLETNEVLTIWCGNDPKNFHDAVRQRFTFSIYMETPPVSVRHKIWQRQLQTQGVELPENEVTALARNFQAAPRQITNAIRAAKISDNALDAIKLALPASAKITHGSKEALDDGSSLGAYYNPELLSFKSEHSADDIDRLTQAGKNGIPFALALQGTKGSGMRSMALDIAERSEMQPAECSMDVLKKPTQFSTPEMNIMGAFAAAADSGNLLIIHDIDKLQIASARELAAVSNLYNVADEEIKALTNTFITAAQKHPLPFIITNSNEGHPLSAELLQLFSDKIELCTLEGKQAQQAFTHYFKQEAPENLKDLTAIAIADFARVADFIKRLDDSRKQPENIVKYLEEHATIRKNIAADEKALSEKDLAKRTITEKRMDEDIAAANANNNGIGFHANVASLPTSDLE